MGNPHPRRKPHAGGCCGTKGCELTGAEQRISGAVHEPRSEGGWVGKGPMEFPHEDRMQNTESFSLRAQGV